MTHFPDDPEATDADLVTTILRVVAAIHYFVVRSRLQADFSGVVINTEDSWEYLDRVISTICQRTRAARRIHCFRQRRHIRRNEEHWTPIR